MVIWGTDVVVEESREKFMKFITGYICAEFDEQGKLRGWSITCHNCHVSLRISDHPGIDGTKPFYFQKLEKIGYVENQLFFDLDCVHLKEFDEALYRQLINYPSELIPIFDMATNEVFYDKVAKAGQILEHQIQVRPFNVDRTKSLRSLDPNDIDQLVTIKGRFLLGDEIRPN